jgi:hypothetical protein
VRDFRLAVTFPSGKTKSVLRFAAESGYLDLPPEIEVSADAVGIADGGLYPIGFGTVSRGDAAIERTFTIRNPGDSDLYVQPVALSNNSGFEIVRPPYHYLTPGGITTLRMRTDVVVPLSAGGEIRQHGRRRESVRLPRRRRSDRGGRGRA